MIIKGRKVLNSVCHLHRGLWLLVCLQENTLPKYKTLQQKQFTPLYDHHTSNGVQQSAFLLLILYPPHATPFSQLGNTCSCDSGCWAQPCDLAKGKVNRRDSSRGLKCVCMARLAFLCFCDCYTMTPQGNILPGSGHARLRRPESQWQFGATSICAQSASAKPR